jgi:hypothetical protein
MLKDKIIDYTTEDSPKKLWKSLEELYLAKALTIWWVLGAVWSGA